MENLSPLQTSPAAGRLTPAQLEFWQRSDLCVDGEYSAGYSWHYQKTAKTVAIALHRLLRNPDWQITFQRYGYQMYRSSQQPLLRQQLCDPAIALDQRAHCWLAYSLELGQQSPQQKQPQQKQMSLEQMSSPLATPLTAVCGLDYQLLFALAKLLLQHHQLHHLANILEVYQQRCWQEHRIIRVRVWSASSLSPQQCAAIQKTIQQRYGKCVRLQCYLQPKLLGGLIVELGHRCVDNSWTALLQRLKKTIQAK